MKPHTPAQFRLAWFGAVRKFERLMSPVMDNSTRWVEKFKTRPIQRLARRMQRLRVLAGRRAGR